MIQYSQTWEVKNSIIYLSLTTRRTTTIFSFEHQSCAWPRAGPFYWQNPCSGCNSGVELTWLLFLNEYALFCCFLHCHWTNLLGLPGFRKSYSYHSAFVLIKGTLYLCFTCAIQSGNFPFFADVCSQLLCIWDLCNLQCVICNFVNSIIRWISRWKSW